MLIFFLMDNTISRSLFVTTKIHKQSTKTLKIKTIQIQSKLLTTGRESS
ncbi:hypothetical protein SAMN05660226_01959 [Parapedobacter luteus]|uniref:Uncharacterized protein n=1 Tax=Parapedobacter luteus TaxID=623280 RepID=A0A1T5C7X2_9SPHI|nr:hypothetical protein SAMN05660226_01959 [Parapedobacter luteus]